MDALYTALSGLLAQSGALNQVAGNLANASSTGYLSQTGAMVDGASAVLYRTGGTGTQALGKISGGLVYTNSLNLAPSPLDPSGVATDLAVSGNAFFAVKTPQGTAYTRNGAFSVNAAGELVTPGGDALLGAGGVPLRINPLLPLQVGAGGAVRQGGAVVGHIPLFGLKAGTVTALGGGLYQTTAKAAPAVGAAVVQGSLDGANVSVVDASQALLQAQASYQSLTDLVNQEAKRLATADGLGVLA